MNQKNHITRQPLNLIIRNNSDKPQTAYVLGDRLVYEDNNVDISIHVEQPGGESSQMYGKLLRMLETYVTLGVIDMTKILCDPFGEYGNQKFPSRLKTIGLFNRQNLMAYPLHFQNKYLHGKSGRNNKVYIINGVYHFIIAMPANYCIRLELYFSLKEIVPYIFNNDHNPSTIPLP